MASGSSKSSVKLLKWRRYPDMSAYGGGDRWHPSTTIFDAVKFTAKTQIKFYGFGCCGSYDKKNMLIKVCWEVDSVRSAEHEIELYDDQKDESNMNTHEIDIR